MSLQFLRIALLVPLITLGSWAQETTLVKMMLELYAWLQGTMLMQALDEIRNHDEEDWVIILILFHEYWMPRCVSKHITRSHEWQANLIRRWEQALESSLSRYEEPAGQTVPVDQNTAAVDALEEEPVIKLEEEDTEEILDILDIPDAPATPNTPTTTPLPNTPDDSDVSDISAGIYESDESPLDHKENQPRRTNRSMPPRGGLERPRSILESLGWVKVAATEHEMESGIDGNMAGHE